MAASASSPSTCRSGGKCPGCLRKCCEHMMMPKGLSISTKSGIVLIKQLRVFFKDVNWGELFEKDTFSTLFVPVSDVDIESARKFEAKVARRLDNWDGSEECESALEPLKLAPWFVLCGQCLYEVEVNKSRLLYTLRSNQGTFKMVDEEAEVKTAKGSRKSRCKIHGEMFWHMVVDGKCEDFPECNAREWASKWTRAIRSEEYCDGGLYGGSAHMETSGDINRQVPESFEDPPEDPAQHPWEHFWEIDLESFGPENYHHQGQSLAAAPAFAAAGASTAAIGAGPGLDSDEVPLQKSEPRRSPSKTADPPVVVEGGFVVTGSSTRKKRPRVDSERIEADIDRLFQLVLYLYEQRGDIVIEKPPTPMQIASILEAVKARCDSDPLLCGGSVASTTVAPLKRHKALNGDSSSEADLAYRLQRADSETGNLPAQMQCRVVWVTGGQWRLQPPRAGDPVAFAAVVTEHPWFVADGASAADDSTTADVVYLGHARVLMRLRREGDESDEAYSGRATGFFASGMQVVGDPADPGLALRARDAGNYQPTAVIGCIFQEALDKLEHLEGDVWRVPCVMMFSALRADGPGDAQVALNATMRSIWMDLISEQVAPVKQAVAELNRRVDLIQEAHAELRNRVDGMAPSAAAAVAAAGSAAQGPVAAAASVDDAINVVREELERALVEALLQPSRSLNLRSLFKPFRKRQSELAAALRMGSLRDHCRSHTPEHKTWIMAGSPYLMLTLGLGRDSGHLAIASELKQLYPDGATAHGWWRLPDDAVMWTEGTAMDLARALESHRLLKNNPSFGYLSLASAFIKAFR
eukprot:c3390_g1_i1.p1 GENE.c3390_g1_i1~~c3390_g1_i1.p1  ORF type:complete len:811 (+),score=74.36 c3390_g1_i1:102-2534(+)